MLRQLRLDSDRTPSLSRDKMMEMFDEAWELVYEFSDPPSLFRKNANNIKFDGSEDNEVSRDLWNLVGKLEFLVYTGPYRW